jgi:hypothetical protein
VSEFASTDYKVLRTQKTIPKGHFKATTVQGRTLDRVVFELRGTRATRINGEAVPSQCDPYSLYAFDRFVDNVSVCKRSSRASVSSSTSPLLKIVLENGYKAA